MNAKEQLRHEWAARIADYRASGLTLSAWCAANQFTINQLKYWLYKAKSRPSASKTPSSTPATHWVPLTLADSAATPAPTLVIRVGPANIELHSGFDPKLLREVIFALGESSC